MPIKTAEEFLSLLERSSLLSPAELAKARELSTDNLDAAQFAKTLVGNQIITQWQKGHLLQGRTSFLLGKYRLIKLLGRGGMGSVFLASHVVMHRKVALKFIPARIARNPAALERFLAEARTVAALDHSNIVRAYSVDNEGDRYYLVMEYVDGMDLQRAVEAYGPLDPEAAADYLRQAADGLAHAHSRNMIHCDIKPSNLIVTEDGTVKILDMGLARLALDKPGAAESDSPENHILGSVDYLAPEQALASPDFNHRADIYALGCTLYFLLTGQPPFPSGSLAQRIVKHQTQEPADITRERPEAPASLTAICKKMMAKNPADRYQTAAEVRDVLAAWQPEVPQPAKKTIAIKKIEPIEEISATSPWEQEFGEELKNMASASGANEFGMPPGMSGKMPAIKNGSSSVKLKQMLAGTRERLILTSCTVAVLLVFLAAGIILSIVFSGTPNKLNGNGTNLPDQNVTQNQSPSQARPPAPQTVNNPPQNGTPEMPAPPTPATPNKEANPPVPPIEQQGDKKEEKPPVESSQPPAESTQPAEHASTADPLKELVSAVELPASDAPQDGVFLGKVHLDAQAKLQIELIGGDKASKGFGKYTLQEDPNAVGGQAWNITRIESRGKTLPVARLKLKGQDLNFDWAPTLPPALANPLRNCGVSIAVGETSRFVQFRIPKSAEPLILDLDKGTPSIHLRLESLPEPDKLKLKIEALKEPFPAYDIKPEVAGSSNKRMVEIGFTDPNYSIFSIYVVYDVVKKDTLVLDASAALRNRPFKLAAGDGILNKLSAELTRKTRQLNEAKNNSTAKANLQPLVEAAKTDLKQFTDSIDLAKKLDGRVIHYRFVADYEKYQVELCNSLLPPPKETIETAKTASPPERMSGKKESDKE